RFEAVAAAVADEVDDAARAGAAQRDGAGDERDLRLRAAHGDDAGRVGRRERRGAAVALRFLHEVVVAGLDRAGEERRDAVGGPRRGGGGRRLDAPAVERHRRRAGVVELDEVVRVRRAGVAAAAVDLADLHGRRREYGDRGVRRAAAA